MDEQKTTERDIDAELVRAGVVDLEVGRMLAKAGVDAGRELKGVVTELVKGKPYLFARAHAGAANAPRAKAGASAELEAAAVNASRTGDRRSLLSYLRLRRGG